MKFSLPHPLQKFLQFSLRILLPGLLVIAALAVSLRGNWGNPGIEELNQLAWKDNGPFELSPERGRFALMYSFIEENSFQFSLPVAKFAAPDVAIKDGTFVSMFAPGISFVILPGYLLGKYWNIAQVGSYAMIALFGFFNFWLVRGVAKQLGANTLAATLAGFTFLFATPAFPYAVSLYQHHVSTFLLLAAVSTLLKWNNLKSLVVIWVLCAISVMIDNPNFFFFVPVGLFALGRFIQVTLTETEYVIDLKPLGIFTFLPALIPIAVFLYVNFLSYGNPLQLAGTNESGRQEISALLEAPDIAHISKIEEVTDEDETAEEQLQEEQDKKPRSALGFFKTRNMPNGLYTLLLSVDRGTLMYTPVMFLGFVGLFFIKKEQLGYKQLLLSVVLTVVLVYSMWGDPYGGWAFGSRYLIPAYALTSVGLGLLLSKYRKNIFVLLFSASLIGYSLFVNTVGALTTSRIPPKVQVLSIEALSGRRERYTYTRGMEMLDHGNSKSFFYQAFASRSLTAWEFTIAVASSIGAIMLVFLLALFISAFPKKFAKSAQPLKQKTRKRKKAL